MTVNLTSFARIPGVPHLDDLGRQLCVTFPVRARPGAAIVWLNTGWWIHRGWDVDNASVRSAVEQWLLTNFAVLACSADEQASGTLTADRYGGSFGTRHGGSGRCGVAGAFNAKGIGRTPLCPPDVQGVHGDGRLSMVEALREAVASELAGDELPWGSIPVVAIIANGDPSEGEATLVRPNFVRPAHFERSIFFGSAGYPGSDQHFDAMRTRDAVATVTAYQSALNFPGLEVMFARFAAQLGAAQAHRLWQGKFLSSNVAITGALVDFGSFRSVPSWRRFYGEPEEHFGHELPYLELAARSVAASFVKYAGASDAPAPTTLVKSLAVGLERGFADAVAAALALNPMETAAVVSLLHRYWVRQQRERLQVGDRWTWHLPWLHDILARPDLAGSPSHATETVLLAELDGVVGDIGVGAHRRRHLLRSALGRWTRPRPEFHYEQAALLLARVADAIRHRPDHAASYASGAVDALLSRVGRYWQGLPTDLIVEGQVRQGHTLAIYGRDGSDGTHRLLLRGPHCEGATHLFGSVVDADARFSAAGWITADFDGNIGGPALARIGTTTIRVPRARLRYAPAINGPHKA